MTGTLLCAPSGSLQRGPKLVEEATTLRIAAQLLGIAFTPLVFSESSLINDFWLFWLLPTFLTLAPALFALDFVESGIDKLAKIDLIFGDLAKLIKWGSYLTLFSSWGLIGTFMSTGLGLFALGTVLALGGGSAAILTTAPFFRLFLQHLSKSEYEPILSILLPLLPFTAYLTAFFGLLITLYTLYSHTGVNGFRVGIILLSIEYPVLVGACALMEQTSTFLVLAQAATIIDLASWLTIRDAIWETLVKTSKETTLFQPSYNANTSEPH